MWEGFRSDQTQGYSHNMFEAFNAFLSGTDVQAWILEAMSREIESAEGVPPVSVEEWLKMGGNKKQSAKQTESLPGGLKDAVAGQHKTKP
jgi:hypothetical protein